MRNFLRLAAACAALSFQAVPVLAQVPAARAEWVLVSTDEAAGETDYIDTASIKTNGDKVRFRHRTEFKTDPDGWQTSVMELEFNCEARKMRMLNLEVIYTDGRQTSDEGPDRWFDIPPESLAAEFLPRVCKQQ